MALMQKIGFVATFEDGQKAHFDIDRFTLRGGDHLARFIAGERQREGRLPEGKIVSVQRAPNRLDDTASALGSGPPT